MPRPNGYLLDTNVVVALVRNNDLGSYLDSTYRLTAGIQPFYVSVVLLGEVRALALKFGWAAARQASLVSLLALFTPLDISYEDVLQAYADIDAHSEAHGRTMGKNDLWMAATARAFDLTLLTTDTDFDHLHGAWIDLEWVDPTSKLPP
jgi:tRNA(fMet)-specific endonuclease VapC